MDGGEVKMKDKVKDDMAVKYDDRWKGGRSCNKI